MKFTYYGHACFAIETAGKKLLFDPFITGNELAKDVDINTIDNYVLDWIKKNDYKELYEFLKPLVIY